MDEPRKRNLRWLLGLVALALAAGALLAASALAGGGNSTPPAAPSKAKVTPAKKAPAKVRSHSGHQCPRDSASSSLDV
jgi:nitrous oxide reductase